MDKLPSSSHSRQHIGAVLLFTLTAFVHSAATASAQYHDRDLPADSVAWWTLSEELSPQQYREIYRSAPGALARYQEDVSAGKKEALAPDRAAALTFYINADKTPELVPLWVTFDAFTNSYLERLGRKRLVEVFTEAGLSELGIQLFLDTAARRQALFQEATDLIWPVQFEFMAFQLRAEEALGGDLKAYRTFRSALTRSDALFLAPLGGETVGRTEELLAAAKTDPGLVAAQQLLPELRAQLSDNDWRALCAYLFAEIAVGMGSFRVFEG